MSAKKPPHRIRKLASLFLLSAGALSPFGTASPQQLNRLQLVEHSSQPGLTRVVVYLERSVPYQVGRLTGPARIYFDFAQTALARQAQRLTQVGDGQLERIRLGQFRPSVARLVLDLAADVEDIISQAEAPPRLIIELRNPRLSSPPPQLEPPPQEPDLTPLIERLSQRIEDLEKTVSELRSQAAAPDPLPGRVGQIEEQVEQLQQGASETQVELETIRLEALQQQILEVEPAYPNLKITGFGDVNFSASDAAGARSGFNQGQFVLHLNSSLAARLAVHAELAWTALADDSFRPTVERAHIRYSFSDALKLAFGRFHTPISWWNTAFHHGAWLQTSVDRPEMVRFGTNFVPVHFVGALLEGQVPAGGLNLNYAAGLGNGRSFNLAEPGDSGDVNSNRAWLAGLYIKPEGIFGLRAGASLYRDKISLADGRDFREWISSAHLIYSKEGKPEFAAEFINVRHRPARGLTVFDSPAYYVQIGYSLPWWDRLWKPYFRYERMNVRQDDPIMQIPFGMRGGLLPFGGERFVAGLRYDLSLLAALKAEFRRDLQRSRSGINAGFLQFSFTF